MLSVISMKTTVNAMELIVVYMNSGIVCVNNLSAFLFYATRLSAYI